MTILLGFATLLCLTPLFLVVYYLLKIGIGSLSLSFFIHNPKPLGEIGGGMLNSIIGSVITVGLASLMGIPVGLLTGMYLYEFGTDKLAFLVKILVDVLNGLPSIIIGLMIYFWISTLKTGFSAFAGSIALSLMMIPIIARSTEEVLRMFPNTLKEAAYALGASRPRTMFSVALKTTLGGILSGVLSSIARISGETAPLLFTAFGNQFFSLRLNRPMSSLPLQIFTYARSPNPEQNKLAWAGALVLVGMVFVLNIVSKWIRRSFSKRS